IGREGYEILINNSLEKARYFADLITAETDFELVSKPELCLLTYRYVPQSVQIAMAKAREIGDIASLTKFNALLDGLTKFVQKTQREQGSSFVSRTRINPENHQLMDIKAVVFRVVLANPLTSHEILQQVLAEQVEIANSETQYLPQLLLLAQS
ncbi:putative pyridoxal-dependent aspartate 1-decarboxylase, partial [Shewanella frigidimarina]